MSKSDLQARPICHHKRESIEAHLAIVFAALAASRWIEARTGWSIRKFVKTAAGTARSRSRPDPAPSPLPTLPDDLRDALTAISQTARGTH